jgi:uncharacterized damage-inducible protein DinB
MQPHERYRELYEYEKDCNRKMLAMLESVPEANRKDARFQQAVNIAGHLAACRENWLDRMVGDGLNQAPWFEDACEISTLPARFAAIEKRWSDYFATIDETELAREFEFPVRGGDEYRWYVEGQILQLIGHAPYHRGQVSLLVDQLGGETVDTDYLMWAYARNPGYGKV